MEHAHCLCSIRINRELTVPEVFGNSLNVSGVDRVPLAPPEGATRVRMTRPIDATEATVTVTPNGIMAPGGGIYVTARIVNDEYVEVYTNQEQAAAPSAPTDCDYDLVVMRKAIFPGVPAGPPAVG